MSDTPNGADLEPVVAEQVDAPIEEDQYFDSLDDAADALADDMLDDEQPVEDGEEPEPEAEEEPEGEEAEEPESDPSDAFVEMPDGTELSLSEIADLQANGLRAQDYTHKTTEVAREREAVDAAKQTYSDRIQYAETTLQKLSGFVESLIPPEPSIELAQTNPGAYTQQLAVRNGALSELQKVFAIKDDMQAHKGKVSEADMSAYSTREGASLVKAMPHLADPVKKAAFDKSVAETAAEFGFTPEEIASTKDHKILQLVHYARLGKQASKNRANAKRRVQTPTKGKAKVTKAPVQNAKNMAALKRLSKSGSINDAMDIDFD